MANMIIGTPNYVDSNETFVPTFSGGTWSGSLPLTNLQDRRLAKVARSSAATTASTQFDIDLKAARACRVFAIPKHNLGLAATVRIRGSTTAGSEGPATNLALWSEEFQNTVWDNPTIGVTVTADQAAGNDGTTTADKLDFAATTSYRYQAVAPGGSIAGKTYTFSVYVWSPSKATIVLRLHSNADGTDQTRTQLTLTTGITRYMVTRTFTTAGTQVVVGFDNRTVAGGDGLAGFVYAWGAQLEESASAGGYVKTTSSSASGTGTLVYDSGAVNVFPSAAAVTAEELAEQRAQGFNFGFTHVAPTAQTARYWKIEITDTTNAAGYVELGRLVIAGAWQPTVNMEYGVKLGWETSSTRAETDGGAAVYNDRPRRRTVQGVIGHLPEAEALSNPFDIQRKLGTTKQLFFVFDPDDVAHMHRRSFLCVHRELSALDFPYFQRTSIPFGLIEEL